MFKRRVKLRISWALVVLTTISLVFSTFHFHHELKHSASTADTERNITTDVNHCPMCGYNLKADLSTFGFDGVVFFFSREINIQDKLFPAYIFDVIVKGRSPPISG